MPAMPPTEYIIAGGGIFSTLASGLWAYLTQRQNAAERLMNTTFSQAQQTIISQGESILRLEGRITELSNQMSTMVTENARLAATNVRLEAELAQANKTIAEHEIEIADLRRRLGETT